MNCNVCGAEIPATGKRGRPAMVCPACKALALANKKTRAPKATPPTVEVPTVEVPTVIAEVLPQG
jgi:hypothetical protein